MKKLSMIKLNLIIGRSEIVDKIVGGAHVQ